MFRDAKIPSDKGKKIVTSTTRQPKDMTKILFKAQTKERLVLGSSRRRLSGGMDKEESSKNQDTTKQQEISREQRLSELNKHREGLDNYATSVYLAGKVTVQEVIEDRSHRGKLYEEVKRNIEKDK